MADFTPGPWSVVCPDEPRTPEFDGWHTIQKGHRVIANVHIEDGNEMDRANASLIAAAPELYRALKNVIGALSDDPSAFDFAIKQAEEALAKAKGEA